MYICRKCGENIGPKGPALNEFQFRTLSNGRKEIAASELVCPKCHSSNNPIAV